MLEYSQSLNKRRNIESGLLLKKNYNGEKYGYQCFNTRIFSFEFAGSSLSIAAYSSFRDRIDDQKLLLIIATFFIFGFLVILILSA